MSQFDPNKFKFDILNMPLRNVVDEYIFKGDPYVFRENPHLYTRLTEHLQDQIKIENLNCSIVGSAKCGFSLNPNNFPRSFSPTSDIDVLVVNDMLFDKIWMTLLEW